MTMITSNNIAKLDAHNFREMHQPCQILDMCVVHSVSLTKECSGEWQYVRQYINYDGGSSLKSKWAASFCRIHHKIQTDSSQLILFIELHKIHFKCSTLSLSIWIYCNHCSLFTIIVSGYVWQHAGYLSVPTTKHQCSGNVISILLKWNCSIYRKKRRHLFTFYRKFDVQQNQKTVAAMDCMRCPHTVDAAIWCDGTQWIDWLNSWPNNQPSRVHTCMLWFLTAGNFHKFFNMVHQNSLKSYPSIRTYIHFRFVLYLSVAVYFFVLIR